MAKIFTDEIRKNIVDFFQFTPNGGNYIYKWICDYCNPHKSNSLKEKISDDWVDKEHSHRFYAKYKNLGAEELTLFVFYGLEKISQVKKITNFHPVHIMYVAKEINKYIAYIREWIMPSQETNSFSTNVDDYLLASLDIIVSYIYEDWNHDLAMGIRQCLDELYTNSHIGNSGAMKNVFSPEIKSDFRVYLADCICEHMSYPDSKSIETEAVKYLEPRLRRNVYPLSNVIHSIIQYTLVIKPLADGSKQQMFLNTQGDLILGNKHVQTQVSHVGAGGIGAQITKENNQ